MSRAAAPVTWADLLADYGEDVTSACGARRYERRARPLAPPRELDVALWLRADARAYGSFVVRDARGRRVRHTGGEELARFRRWWWEIVGRSVESDKCRVTPMLGWQLWRESLHAGPQPRLQRWTNVQVRSVRELEAHLAIEDRLGEGYVRRRTSWSGVTVTAPQLLSLAAGRDLVRLGRLRRSALVYLLEAAELCHAIDGSGRIVWRYVAHVLRRMPRGSERAILQGARVPAALWHEAQQMADAEAWRVMGWLATLSAKGADISVLGGYPWQLWRGDRHAPRLRWDELAEQTRGAGSAGWYAWAEAMSGPPRPYHVEPLKVWTLPAWGGRI